MMGLPIAFASPLILSALVLLPVIWWLLRLTPPRPRREEFPPTRLLLEIARKEETPSKSPWWLTALRLLMAALVIIALAGPIFRPATDPTPGEGPLLVVVENGWAAAARWEPIVATARRLIDRAGETGRSVALVATAEGPSQQLAADDASAALSRLDALEPRPWARDRAALIPPLTTIAAETGFGQIAWLADGLGGDDIDTFAGFLNGVGADDIAIYDDRDIGLAALRPPASGAEALEVPVIRRSGDSNAAGLVRARDLKGRIIGEVTYAFEPGATLATPALEMPSELRNEIVRVEIAGAETAGAVQLLDERWRRRRIGLLTGASADVAQPLLAPLYYISRALAPYADIREPRDANVALAVPDVIEAGVSIIAMADIGTLTPEIEAMVADWVEEGGTLVRFAGPRLAAATDALTPVRLRRGGRILGGSLSWETPQKLAFFAQDSPFAGMPIPDDIEVQRQVLAEPDGDLSERTWAGLADGTPLVTAAAMGRGRVILFHVTADTSWSNLPISGTFVEMLRRIVSVSNAVGTGSPDSTSEVALLPPYRLLDGFGRFSSPDPAAEPIVANIADLAIDAEHPPGLYGQEDGFRSLNLLDETAELPRFDPQAVGGATVLSYPTESPRELAPWLLSAAAILLLIDALAVLWLGGAFSRRASYAAGLVLAAMPGLAFQPTSARADEIADKFALDAVNQTHLAYVMTGNPEIDDVSLAGLRGLSRALADRTALEPGEPRGVDVARDELAFFPLLYWPVDPDGHTPTSETMARVDAFMKQGGSILFDTRDQLQRSTSMPGFSGTPAQERLREMLASLDIPPLEPVPTDHVLTKAFYLLTEFPGRYLGGALWVEVLAPDTDGQDRPARAGDGVTPILITANDFAGAWAEDEFGDPIYPTVPNQPLQREYAFRSGINIVMYTLTGNYKADQVHVPALLERLGQ